MSEYKKLSHTLVIHSFLENYCCAAIARRPNSRSILTTSISHEKMEWKLQVYNKIDDGNPRIAVSLELLNSDCAQGVRAKYGFAILDVSGRRVHKKHGINDFLPGSQWGHSTFVLEKELRKNSKDLLPRGILTIYTEIDARTLPSPRGFDLVNRLYEDLEFTDVTIQVGEKEFKAHKAVLVARSPVLRQMFAHDMVEKNLNTVRVVDFEADVVEEMLKFIYTNETSLDKISKEEEVKGRDLAVDLFKAADKYQIDDLKLVCEKSLYESLSVDCALQTLELADRYNSHQLKQEAIEFINLNITTVTSGNDDWSSVVRERPEFALDVLSRIVSHMSGPKSERIQLFETML